MILQDKTFPGRWMGKLFRCAVAEHIRLNLHGSRSDPPRNGSWQFRLQSQTLTIQNLRHVSHESFASHLQRSDFDGHLAKKLHSHILTVRFWGTLRTKASFSNLQLSDFEGRFARKLPSQIFNCQILKAVSHESFVFTSSTVRFWCGSPAQNAFLRVSGWSTTCALQVKTCHRIWMGKLFRRAVADPVRLNLNHGQIDTLVEVPVYASLCYNFLARSSVALCNSVCPDRTVVLSILHQSCLALEWPHQGWDSDLWADFLNFGAGDFPFKTPFRKWFNIVLWRRDPVLELQFLTFLRVVFSCCATQSLQTALQWLRQGGLAPRLRG